MRDALPSVPAAPSGAAALVDSTHPEIRRSARWRAARFVLVIGSLILAGAVLATLITLRYANQQETARQEQQLARLANMFTSEATAGLSVARGEITADDAKRLSDSAQRYADFSSSQFLVLSQTGTLIAASSLPAGVRAALPFDELVKRIPTSTARGAFRERIAFGEQSFWLAMQPIDAPTRFPLGTKLWTVSIEDEQQARTPYAERQGAAWQVASIFSVAMLVLMVGLAIRYARSEREAETSQQALNLEVKYRDLIEAQQIVKCGSWTTEAQTDTFFPSLEYLNIFKLTGETCPKTVSGVIEYLVHSDQQASAFSDMKRILVGAAYEGTRKVTLRDGTEKWLLFKSEPRFDAANKRIGNRGIVIDVTEQQLVAQRVIDSDKRYQLITENVTDIVSLHDKDGRVLYCSPSLERVFGYKPSKSVGIAPLELVHPDDQGDVLSALRALIDRKLETITLVYRFRDIAGHYRWLESVLVTVYDHDKDSLYFQLSSRDITARKDAEFALRGSEERFRSLTELSADWYWEQDTDYRFTFISKAPPAAAAVISDALIGCSHWDAFPSALKPAEWVAHRADLAARRPFQDLIAEMIGPQASSAAYYSLSGRPVFDDRGIFAGYRGTGRDITARHLSELSLARRTRELAETNAVLKAEVETRLRLERDFLYAIEMELSQIGHELHDDLGQNLTGISLLSAALSRKLRDQGHAGNIEATRISELVNRTIEHTRMISHGLSPYIWGATGLEGALNQLASDIETLGTVKCETALEPVDITDEIVSRSLYRIAQESVNNALKHSQASCISIALHEDNEGVLLSVSDDGIGAASTTRTPDLTERRGRHRKFHSLRHRAGAIGAMLTVGDALPGKRGTVISVRWAASTKVISLLPQTPTQTVEETS